MTFYLIDNNNNKFKVNDSFLDWFIGFTDAEGNFTIVLKDNPRYVKNISFLRIRV